MFLAIINDTYGDVKADLKVRKPDFQMSDFFKTGINNVKGWMGIHDRCDLLHNPIHENITTNVALYCIFWRMIYTQLKCVV